MNQHTNIDASLRSYLLGTAAPGENELLEERLMTDDDLYERLLLAEDELVDDFVTGDLDGRERDLFANHFLVTAERRQKLRLATNLRKYAARAKKESDKTQHWFERLRAYIRGTRPVVAFSLASLILLAAGALFVITRRRAVEGGDVIASRTPAPESPAPSPAGGGAGDSGGVSPVNVPSPEPTSPSDRSGAPPPGGRPREGEVPSPSVTPTPRRAGRSVFTAQVLALGGVRAGGGGLQTVTIPVGATDVELPLELVSGDYRSVRCTLLDDEGGVVLPERGVRQRELKGVLVAVLRVPARLLQEREYQVRLEGVTPGGENANVGRYYFRVRRP